MKKCTLLSLFAILSISLTVTASNNGTIQLLDATKNQNIKLVETLVQLGVDINSRSSFEFQLTNGDKMILNCAALHVAAFYHYPDLTQVLLNLGAQSNLETNDTYALYPRLLTFYLPKSENQARVFKMLLEDNPRLPSFNFNKFPNPSFANIQKSKDPLDIFKEYFSGTFPNFASNMTREKEDNISLTEYIAAAESGGLATIKRAINAKVHLTDTKNHALYSALSNGKLECVKYILNNTFPKIVNKHYFAAGLSLKRHEDIKKSEALYGLLKKADASMSNINIVNSNTELESLQNYIKAAQNGNINKLKQAIASKAHLLDTKGSALYQSLSMNNHNCVKYILENTTTKIFAKHYFAAGLSFYINNELDSSKKLHNLLTEHSFDIR